MLRSFWACKITTIIIINYMYPQVFDHYFGYPI
jgi:hypothetical protein